jgi:PRTRC genetic system protein A
MMMTKPAGYLTNSLTGLQGESGIFYDYIMAGNGIFLKAKNQLLSVTVNIAYVEVRGLEDMQENITLVHGKIPRNLLTMAIAKLMTSPDIEKYLAITWEGQSYWLKEPVQEAGAGHVSYETFPNTILDIHSHTGSMPAQFSSIDNRDEKGFCIYAVAADLRNLFPSENFRLGVYGYMLPLEKSEIFE